MIFQFSSSAVSLALPERCVYQDALAGWTQKLKMGMERSLIDFESGDSTTTKKTTPNAKPGPKQIFLKSKFIQMTILTTCEHGQDQETLAKRLLGLNDADGRREGTLCISPIDLRMR